MANVDGLVAVRHLRGALEGVVDHTLIQVRDWILVKGNKPEASVLIGFPVLKSFM